MYKKRKPKEMRKNYAVKKKKKKKTGKKKSVDRRKITKK
jgi:hypothetical protein